MSIKDRELKQKQNFLRYLFCICLLSVTKLSIARQSSFNSNLVRLTGIGVIKRQKDALLLNTGLCVDSA